jgi:hypothetical protein
MNKENMIIAALFCVVLLIIAFMFRYQIVSVPRADSFGIAYKLNRITGTVYVLHGSIEERVKQAREESMKTDS